MENIIEQSEIISREELIEFASTRPTRDEEVKEMLTKWLEQTRIPEDSQDESIEYVKVSIMHTAMKYRLGFMSKQEALDELRVDGIAIESEFCDGIDDIRLRFYELIYDIENDEFEVLHAEK